MAGGVYNYNTNKILRICECGNTPTVIWHYIKGVANKIHYFVKCDDCMKRTRDRRKPDKAIEDWNNNIIRKSE